MGCRRSILISALDFFSELGSRPTSARVRPRAHPTVLLVAAVACLSGCRPQLITHAGLHEQRLAGIQGAIEELRGLPFTPPARVELLDDEGMESALLGLRLSENSQRMMRLWSLIDRACGDPWNMTPEEAARRLPTDTSFAVYSPEDDALFLSRARLLPAPLLAARDPGDSRDAVAEIVITHELTHAWQRRHFPQLFAAITDVDRWSAWRALLEGDAEVTTLALTQGSTSTAALEHYLRVRRRMAVAAGQDPAQNRDWQLRYDRATRFARDVVRRRGWQGLNAVLADPPQATAAVVRGDAGANTDPAAPLGTMVACPDGWRVAVDTAVGAFHIPELLKISSATTLIIGGWRADRLRICARDDTNDFILRWRSRWDGERSAQRFLVAARERLEGRPGAAVTDGREDAHIRPVTRVERRGLLVEVVRISSSSESVDKTANETELKTTAE